MKLPKYFYFRVTEKHHGTEIEVEDASNEDVVEVVRCRDCKHYLRNKIYVVDGMPLMGNQVCEKWGDGCRTDENGFCFMGERREANGNSD